MRVVMIDGSNTFAACKNLQLQLDWSKVLRMYEGSLLRAYYFTALPAKDIESPQRKLADWLSYNGYSVVTKDTKSFLQDDGTTKTKGNMDIEIATACFRLIGKVSHIDLWSGDGDFAPLIELLKDHGVYVTVYSSTELGSNGNVCADLMRKVPDAFVDIKNIAEQLVRVRPVTGLAFRRG